MLHYIIYKSLVYCIKDKRSSLFTAYGHVYHYS